MTGNIQFDDPLLAYFCAESMIKGMEEKGVDHERLLQLYIDTYNLCLKNRPADMNVGIHLCRGNFKYVIFCGISSGHSVDRPIGMVCTLVREAMTASLSSSSTS